VTAALNALAVMDGVQRGAVFTRCEVVTAILDLVGYVPGRPLHRMRLLEPCFGDGDFLLQAIDRLLDAYALVGGSAANARDTLADAIRAVELHRNSFERTALRVEERLLQAGLSASDARSLANEWLICDDFLLSPLPHGFDVVIGNPPYVRQERILEPLLDEYRLRFRTLYDRADLYVPFYERGLELLAPKGSLGFICANRWVKNKYGGPLRAKIAGEFQLLHYIDMEGVDAFHAEVIAYPSITIIRRPMPGETAPPTRVSTGAVRRCEELPVLVHALMAPTPDRTLVSEIALQEVNDAPWLLDDVPRLKLLRRIEAEWPALEQAGCRVGIGVATGCDRVFIDDFATLPVESERKVPLVMARDLVDGELRWGGKGVLNPFEPDGRLASLEEYPQFSRFLHQHRDAVAGRHVAAKNPAGWYRTIDRIYPELVTQQKLLIPDIKGESVVVYDEGRCYPHHNLYYVISDDWDLRALQTVLRSSVAVMFVATYCTRMAGGFLRFQAQYLRRIRLPRWGQVPNELRVQLIAAATVTDVETVDAPVFRLYGLNKDECELVRHVAREAQVTARKRKGSANDDTAAAA
jgi:Eco57I restriction-modification methylase/TaqI-like C-terminal specificity domain